MQQQQQQQICCPIWLRVMDQLDTRQGQPRDQSSWAHLIGAPARENFLPSPQLSKNMLTKGDSNQVKCGIGANNKKDTCGDDADQTPKRAGVERRQDRRDTGAKINASKARRSSNDSLRQRRLRTGQRMTKASELDNKATNTDNEEDHDRDQEDDDDGEQDEDDNGLSDNSTGSAVENRLVNLSSAPKAQEKHQDTRPIRGSNSTLQNNNSVTSELQRRNQSVR